MDSDLGQKRLFVAVNLPQEVKEKIYKASYRFLSNNRNIRQVSYQNIHITLKFLGNIKDDNLHKLKNALYQSVKEVSPFSFRINSYIDAFPNTRKASIILVGLENGSQDIELIFKNIEQQLERINISKEKRRYIPHATIARVKHKTDITAVKKELIFKNLPAVRCDRITLFESKLEPTGAQYSVVEEFILGKPFNLN